MLNWAWRKIEDGVQNINYEWLPEWERLAYFYRKFYNETMDFLEETRLMYA